MILASNVCIVLAFWCFYKFVTKLLIWITEGGDDGPDDRKRYA